MASLTCVVVAPQGIAREYLSTPGTPPAPIGRGFISLHSPSVQSVITLILWFCPGIVRVIVISSVVLLRLEQSVVIWARLVSFRVPVNLISQYLTPKLLGEPPNTVTLPEPMEDSASRAICIASGVIL